MKPFYIKSIKFTTSSRYNAKSKNINFFADHSFKSYSIFPTPAIPAKPITSVSSITPTNHPNLSIILPLPSHSQITTSSGTTSHRAFILLSPLSYSLSAPHPSRTALFRPSLSLSLRTAVRSADLIRSGPGMFAEGGVAAVAVARGKPGFPGAARACTGCRPIYALIRARAYG